MSTPQKSVVETAIGLANWAKEVQTEMRAQRSEHRYLSTGCLHGEHDYCSSMTGLSGAKRPAQCKFCETTCICECHS